MNSFAQRLREMRSQQPAVLQLTEKDLLSEGRSILWLDLRDISNEEVDTAYERAVVTCTNPGYWQALCLWFTCSFPGGIELQTGPADSPTHWHQTVLVLPQQLPVEKGTPVAYELHVKRSSAEPRRYDIEVEMLDPEEETHPEPCNCHMTKCIIIKKMIEQYEKQNVNEKEET